MKNWGHNYEHSILTFETATNWNCMHTRTHYFFLEFYFILLDTNQLFINCIRRVYENVSRKILQNIWLHLAPTGKRWYSNYDNLSGKILCYSIRFLILHLIEYVVHCNYFVVDKIERENVCENLATVKASILNRYVHRKNLFRSHLKIAYFNIHTHTVGFDFSTTTEMVAVFLVYKMDTGSK